MKAELEKPIRSMTGFAAVRRSTSAGELNISLRAVNHRGLDLHFYQGPEFGAFENAMRGLLKSAVARGHVEVRSSLQGVAAGVNREAVGQYVTAFRAAAEEFGLTGQEPDLNRCLSLTGAVALPEGFEGDVLTALETCVGELNAVRAREGAALGAEIETRLAEIERDIQGVCAARTEALEQFSSRLEERLRELLAGSNVPAARIVEEAAILADRSDIQEELTRLAVHAAEVRRILENGGEIGKKIDFLLQEMNRETNTALAKSANGGEPGLRITRFGLAIKANIERIREQGLNLE